MPGCPRHDPSATWPLPEGVTTRQAMAAGTAILKGQVKGRVVVDVNA